MENVTKWRLILGSSNKENEEEQLSSPNLQEIDEVLEQLYNQEDRKGGLESSSPKLNRWLGDIRRYFPSQVVQVMLKDAIERLNIQRLLLEKEVLEQIEPDVHLVGTLLSLNKMMPDKTRETARIVVRKVVEELEKKLSNPLLQAIKGALSRTVRNRRPRLQEIDWSRTIRDNLKHYQADYKTIIPQHLTGQGRKGEALRDIILCVDQSGSMASSVVYSAIFGAVLASLRSVKTQMVVFDTAVVDLTEQLSDPVELLFATQLGGGTDIAKAVKYCSTLLTRPAETIFVLITDLYEGGDARAMLRTLSEMKSAGVTIVTLLSLSNDGKPVYDHKNAAALAALDIPCFGCTPDVFPEVMAAAIKRENLGRFMG